MEGCWSYDIRSNRGAGRLDLIRRYRKGQQLCRHVIHPVVGLGRVRLQTWLPFNLHVCLNDRENWKRRDALEGFCYYL